MQQPASPIAIEGSLAMRLARHWAELARLAWPVMLSRAGLLTLTLVDIVMVGRFGTGALAHMAMGYSVFVPIMVTGIGAMVGIIAIVSQRWGGGRPDRRGRGVRPRPEMGADRRRRGQPGDRAGRAVPAADRP
ncbi:MAG: hypothetical protein KatS3mg118_1544 [Paracoccaceae bacterium]|nr:MAG: hypothetical protein KatS3mg118_1544 [Paracoccaceae bacterium]